MHAIATYILCGGRSSRFGSDKSLAEIHGRPLILRVADAVAPFASSITAVADVPDKYADLGLRTIADRHPALGPLGGVHAALCDIGTHSWLLAASCDLLELREHWLGALLTARAPHACAIAFRHEHWEPLPALYHREALPEIERRLDEKELSLQSLLDVLPTIAVPLPHDWPPLFQINTKADLAAYLAKPSAPKTQNRPETPGDLHHSD